MNDDGSLTPWPCGTTSVGDSIYSSGTNWTQTIQPRLQLMFTSTGTYTLRCKQHYTATVESSLTYSKCEYTVLSDTGALLDFAQYLDTPVTITASATESNSVDDWYEFDEYTFEITSDQLGQTFNIADGESLPDGGTLGNGVFNLNTERLQ